MCILKSIGLMENCSSVKSVERTSRTSKTSEYMCCVTKEAGHTGIFI